MKTTKQKQEENFENYLKNGPGLRTSYNIFVVARDRKRNFTLKGGLGGMGCGEMWTKDEHLEDEDKKNPEWIDAPEQDAGSDKPFGIL